VHIFDGIRAIGERLHDGVGICRVGVFGDSDDDFVAVGMLDGGAPQSASHFGSRRAVCELQKDDRTDVAQRLVTPHAATPN
jgi:hypothetical protein